MFSLVGGKRVEEGSFAINAKLFDNLVAFCLIFKFFLKSFYSTLHGYQGKILKMKWEKLNFLLFT